MKETFQDQMIVRFGSEFLKEISDLSVAGHHRSKVYVTKNMIWEYIPTTKLRVHWMNKKTWIHKLAEIRWQRYLQTEINYPDSSFAGYLLTQESKTKYYPDTVNLEIRTWFEIRNKILQ